MSSNKVALLLGATPAFSALSPECWGRVVSLLEHLQLAAGEVLAREGDRGDALYLVIEGSIGLTRLERDSDGGKYLGRVGAGEVTGELGLLTGQPRAATMTAEQPTAVASLSRGDFELLCLEFPREMESVIAWMRKRLHSYQIKVAIDESPLLKTLGAPAKSAVEAGFEWTELRSGDLLFREGEAGDALYLIVSGCIQLFCAGNGGNADVPEPEGQEEMLAQLGKGDTLGEMALLTNQPRSAKAIAIRDTQLGILKRETFDRIVTAHPQEMLGLFVHQMAERLREKNLGRQHRGRPPVSIAVLGCSARTMDFAAQLVKDLSAFGSALHLNRASSQAFFLSRPLSPEAAEIRMLSWLNEQETRYNHVVYEADAEEDPWTFRCLRQADILFLVADGETEPQPSVARLQGILDRAGYKSDVHLVLTHGKNVDVPRNTKVWIDAMKPGHHWHLRAGVSEDVSRIARFLTGRTVGLTLGAAMRWAWRTSE